MTKEKRTRPSPSGSEVEEAAKHGPPMDAPDVPPEEIAKRNREAHDEPKDPALRSPGTGGDPEHKRSRLETDETNDLTT